MYVGLLEDDETACLEVMVVKQTTELERAIPKSIEGYPVRIEECFTPACRTKSRRAPAKVRANDQVTAGRPHKSTRVSPGSRKLQYRIEPVVL